MKKFEDYIEKIIRPFNGLYLFIIRESKDQPEKAVPNFCIKIFKLLSIAVLSLSVIMGHREMIVLGLYGFITIYTFSYCYNNNSSEKTTTEEDSEVE